MSKIFPIINVLRMCFKIRKRVRANNDIVMCIYGDEGVGKSTLGILLSILLMMKKTFSFINNVAWTSNPEEIIKKVKKMPKGSVLLLDEAIKFLEKQEWRKSTFIKKLFNVIRGRNLIIILVLPRLIDLTEYFRNHRVLLSIYCYWRGFGILTMKSRIPNVQDPFYIKYNNWLLSKYLENNENNDEITIMQAFEEMKGFKGFLNYPNLPDDVYKVYEKFKLHYDLLNLSDGQEQDDTIEGKQNTLLAKSIVALKEGGMSMGKIAEQLGTTVNRVKYYVYNFKGELNKDK